MCDRWIDTDDLPEPRAPAGLKFAPGAVAVSPGALALLRQGHNLAERLARHLTGDWGDVWPEDRRVNQDALRRGGRLLSAYQLPGGARLWIITDANRQRTTLLLPEEN
jgi:hypothetical protein